MNNFLESRRVVIRGGVAHRDQFFLDIRHLDDFHHTLVQLGLQGRRGLGWHQQSMPLVDLVAGETLLGHGRHIGQLQGSFGRGDAQRNQLARLDVGRCAGRGDDGHRDLAAHDIAQGRTATRVGHMRHVDLAIDIDHRPGQVLGCAIAAGAEGDRVFGRLGSGNER